MVTVQIATIPDREKMLTRTVESLRDQADQINLMLNSYDHVPSVAGTPKVAVYFRDNIKGDAEKFYGLGGIDGYIFTCDDDLIYPPDYVSSMLLGLVKLGNQAILTCHGRIMNEKPVKNSYTDRKAAFHCLKEVKESVQLDIGGTGVMCWHSDYFFPDYNKVESKNMADIWVAKFASEQNCRIMLHPHAEGWMQYQNPHWTIWDEHYPKPGPQTDLYNSFF